MISKAPRIHTGSGLLLPWFLLGFPASGLAVADHIWPFQAIPDHSATIWGTSRKGPGMATAVPLEGAHQLRSAPKLVRRQSSFNLSAQAASARKRKAEATNRHQLREEAAEETRLSEWLVQRASLQLPPPLVSAAERMDNLKRRSADKAAAARKVAQ